MPEPQQASPTQPQWYKKQGADGKWYQTQAASPQEASQKLARAMAAPPTTSATTLSAKPSAPVQNPALLSQKRDPYIDVKKVPKNYGFTVGNVLENVYEGINAAASAGRDIGKDILSNPNWIKEMPTGQRPSTMQKFVFDPADDQMRKAKADYQEDRLIEAAGHFTAGLIPLVGPMAAQLGEQAGSGDVGGATGKAAGMYAFGKATTKGAELAKDAVTGLVDPVSLRQRAAELNTKVLKQADAGAKDYKTSAGLQVANEQVVGTMRSLPSKIEQIRSAKNAKVDALAKYHDQRGSLVDAEKDLAPVLRNTAARLNAQGLLTGPVRAGVQSLLKRITTQWDFKTGREIPRDLSKLKVSEALALTKGLEDLSGFGKDTPKEIEVFARQVRGVINQAMDKVDPEIGKTRSEESRLITARDAARENYAKMLNDKTTMGRGVIYSGAGTLGAYLAMRAMGVFPVAAIGTVVMLRAMAASTPSRTARAALYARAAQLLERSAGTAGGPQGGANAAPAQPVPPRPTGPTLPATGLQRPANAPAAMPTAPRAGALPSSNVGPQAAGGNVTPTGRPLTSQELAVQSQPGGRGVAADIGKWQPPPESGVSNAPDYGKNIRSEVKGRGSIAKSTTTSPTANKAMMDRLDALLERKPRSGAENNAIKREITELKRLISGEATGAEASKIAKRIADRERLASKRAEAGAAQTGSATTGGGEAVSQVASPETRAIALDAGYKALAHYEGGTEMVKALKTTAKAMQKIDPSYDEVEKLTEALMVLKQLGPSN